MIKSFSIFFIASLFLSGVCYSQDVRDMNLAELRTNCIHEIESGAYTGLKNIEVTDFRILAWYRISDTRPWYVDNAMCWAKVDADASQKWILVHMARNPMKNQPVRMRKWHSYFVYDAPNSWFLCFDNPPNNKDIYEKMYWFKFEVSDDWLLYESKILDENWFYAIGEKPTRQFSNKANSANAKNRVAD